MDYPQHAPVCDRATRRNHKQPKLTVTTDGAAMLRIITPLSLSLFLLLNTPVVAQSIENIQLHLTLGGYKAKTGKLLPKPQGKLITASDDNW